ncbi:MAG: DUF3604 domain-containing protein [Planctomycetota bacterium]
MTERTSVPHRTRPVRIPDDIPLEHPQPETAIAGERSTWRLPFRLARDLPAGTPLRLQVWGGRNNKGVFPDLQTDDPGAGGYVTAAMPGGSPIALRPADVDGSFELTVPEPGLAEGDVLTVTLGDRSAGGPGARAFDVRTLDKFFLLYVAADGRAELPAWAVAGSGTPEKARTDPGAHWSDENQAFIVAACTMHILGARPTQLRAYAPSQVRPGESFAIVVRPEDDRANLAHEPPGELAVSLDGEPLAAQREPVPNSTCARLTVALPVEGVHRLTVTDVTRRIETVTNPIVCRRDGGRSVRWGCIHGHTELSDGQGSIDNYFRQMRDEAGLDFGAPGDHDHHWETPDRLWQITCAAVERWNEPGRFVAILGYEWAKWRRNGDGDRNVYYLEDRRPMFRSGDDDFPHPPDLFEALDGETALVIPHHTGHAGNFCDWKDHDPAHERLVEIFQVRGSYERPDDNPVPERGREPVKECGYVSRALSLGWRVGFTAGGDDHVGHAGTEFPIGQGETTYKAGLMAVLADELTRGSIWDALWNRRVVATTGPRILLDYELNGRPLGSELRLTERPDLAARRELRVVFHGTAPAARIDVIRNNEIVHTVRPDALDCELKWSDECPIDRALLPPATFCPNRFCFYYVRAIQADGEVAWASPVWIDER